MSLSSTEVSFKHRLQPLRQLPPLVFCIHTARGGGSVFFASAFAVETKLIHDGLTCDMEAVSRPGRRQAEPVAQRHEFVWLTLCTDAMTAEERYLKAVECRILPAFDFAFRCKDEDLGGKEVELDGIEEVHVSGCGSSRILMVLVTRSVRLHPRLFLTSSCTSSGQRSPASSSMCSERICTLSTVPPT